jgi:O-antigen/teichoic acid export membrane protein
MNLKTKNKTFSNSVWQISQMALRMILGFTIGSYIARSLGPESFGLYSALIAFILIINSLSTLGLQSIVIREFVENKNKSNLFKTTFLLRLAGGLFSCVLAIIISKLIDQSLNLLVFLIPILIVQVGDIWHYYFQSQKAINKSSLSGILAILIASCLQIFALTQGATLEIFLAIVSVEYILVGLFHFVQISLDKDHPLKGGQFDLKLAKRLLKESWPIIISGTALLAHQRIDLALLELLSSPQETGYYAASSRITNLSLSLPPLLLATLYPMFIEFNLKSADFFERRYTSTIRSLSFFSTLAAIFLIVLGPFMINLLYGEAYKESYESLVYLSMAIIPATLHIVLDQLPFLFKKPFSTVRAQLLILLINIGLGFVFIPVHGAAGAALATLFSLSISFLILILLDPLYKKYLASFFNGLFLWISFENKKLHNPFFIFQSRFNDSNYRS